MTGQDFTRLTTPVANAGAWPYNCDQLIPCKDMPHQTCGCKNLLEVANSDNFAIVYNMNVTGLAFLLHETKVSLKPNFKTIHPFSSFRFSFCSLNTDLGIKVLKVLKKICIQQLFDC